VILINYCINNLHGHEMKFEPTKIAELEFIVIDLKIG